MGFQSGSQIRPELGALDYSGYTNAAAINAQAMSNLGQQVGGAIEGYKKKKEETKIKQGQVDQFIKMGESMATSFDKVNPQLAESIRGLTLDVSDGDRPLSERAAMVQNGMQQFGMMLEAGNTANQSQQITQKQLSDLQKSQPKGEVMTLDQIEALKGMGYDITATPEGEGYRVGSVSPFAPAAKGDTFNIGGDGKADTSIFDKKMAERTAEQVVNWEVGGRVNAVANLDAYNDIYEKLASGEYNTRTLADLSPVLSEELRTMFNPTGQAAVDNVRKVVFQSLRDTLGPQFTEKEAIRLTNATYNPALSEEENMRRMQIAGGVLKATIKAKDDVAKFISQGGQMKDYKGQQPIDVFNSSVSEFEPTEKETGTPKDIDPLIWEQMSDEDKKLWN